MNFLKLFFLIFGIFCTICPRLFHQAERFFFFHGVKLYFGDSKSFNNTFQHSEIPR